MTGAVEVIEAQGAEKAPWTEFLGRRTDATVFHDWRWGATVEAAYGRRAIHLMARRGGTVVGVLPLTDIKSTMLGRSLISGAFAVGGGALADDDEALAALGRRALEIGRALGANYVELRGGRAPKEGWTEKTGIYAAFERKLPAHADNLIAWLPKNRRAQIKKAMRIESSGASLKLDGTAREFQPLYAEALRNLGTPTPSIKFFELLKANFGEAVEISLMMQDGAPIAGLFTFWHRDSVLPYYIGGTARAREIFAYDYMYYSLMLRAVERGVKSFDFGRSKVGSTHFATKTYWGFEPAPLVYHVGLVRAKSLPNLSATNPKFAAFSAAWKRLPLPVANALGPVLARHLA